VTAAPDLGSPFVVAEVADGVLHVRLNRPERRNACSQDMYRAIKRAAVWADRQPELDAVCLRGTGEWFAAGGDLSRRVDVDDVESEWDGTDLFPFRHIERSRKIWVAAVNGLCHAGGVDLLLHCDISVASDRARFRVPELLRGLPDPYIGARLVAAVGLARARFMVFTAEEIDAATALRVGLVGDVVAHDELDARIAWVLDRVRATGPAARAALKRDINQRLPAGDPSLFSMVPSAEMAEGMAAFVEKRPVAWPR